VSPLPSPPSVQVVMRLVGANDEILMYHLEKLEWLADTPLLDMLVEQLGPQVRPDFHPASRIKEMS